MLHIFKVASTFIYRLFFFVILCVLLQSLIFTLSAAEYEVDGEIVQTLFKMDGNVQSIQRSKFTVYVRDCAWLIKTADHDETGNLLTTRETACTNGAEIYEVAGTANWAALNGGIAPWNNASIVSNNVPVGQVDDYFVCHLWLMFASGCYFENLTNDWITPVYDLNASMPVNPNLKRQAKWGLLNGPGSLPLNVAYMDGFTHTTNATYVATSITNVGSIQIPGGFIFEERVGSRFAPASIFPGEQDSTYFIRKRAVASVTAVRPACSRNELLPTAKGKTMVIDQRLAHATNAVGQLFYIFQNGVEWVPVDQAKKLTIQPPTGSGHNLSIARVVFFALLLSPSVVFMYFLIKTKRN